MFSRLTHEDWITWVPVVAFILTSGAFIAIVVRALKMEKPERKRMAHLPLEEQPGDAPPEADEVSTEPADTGFLGRLTRNPVFWMVLATCILSGIFAFAH
ncbi:MAG: hypothetical protein ACFB21_16670 [Opitutales bacterium]